MPLKLEHILCSPFLKIGVTIPVCRSKATIPQPPHSGEEACQLRQPSSINSFHELRANLIHSWSFFEYFSDLSPNNGKVLSVF